MGLTFSTFEYGQESSGPTTATITVPTGAAVGILVVMDAQGAMGYFQGAMADTGGNSYVPAGGANPSGAALYCDSFYCLNTGSSATSVTYTPSASYPGGNLYNVTVAAWVWTVSGGITTFGSQSNNGQGSPGTGTDAITSGSVTCATGSVIMGLNRDNGTGTVSVGTGFTLDVVSFGNITGEHGAFSSSQAATWTTNTGTDSPLLSQAISFGLSSGNTAGLYYVS